MANTLTVFKGRKGENGKDGVNGSGVDDIRGSVVDNPLLSLLYNNNISRVGGISVSRLGEALYTDRYDDVAFSSGADITNKVPYSNDFSQWDDPLNKWTILSTNNSDPLGGSTASEIQLDEDIGDSETIFMEESYSTFSNGTKFHTYSFWIKIISGTITGMNAEVGNQFNRINPNLTSTWQRVNVSFTPNGSAFILSLNIVGLSGAKFQIFGAQFEEGSVVHDYIPTTGSPVTVGGDGSAIRENQFGYIITGEKTNIIENSEDLNTSNWSMSSGSIIEYNGLTPLSGFRKEIKIQYSTEPTITLSSTGLFVNGNTYTVSMWLYLLGGSVSSLLASVANGDKVAFGSVSTTGFVRVSVNCVAGSGSGLALDITSPSSNAQLVMFGVQVEADSIGTYIRNGDSPNTQPLDLYVSATELQASSDWSNIFTLKNLPINSDIKYVFYADTNFNAYIQNSDLKVKNGSSIKTIANMVDAENIALTFDGANLKIYKNGDIESTQTVSSPSTTITSNLYLGADSGGDNALNAQLSMFDLFTETLTAQEIKYLTGEL